MSVQHLATLQANQRQQVLNLIQRSTIFDNSPPIAEHILLHLRHGGDKSDSHLIVEVQSKVIGYAHLDQTDLVAGPSVELVVDPDHRSFGIGKQLLSKAVEICGINLRLWVHGENEAAAALANSFNFEKIRTVLQMQKQLTDIEKLPDIDPKIIIRSFLPGLDSNDWLSLNNKVFKNHPEQSDWQLTDLNHRLSEDWFDQKGFFIAFIDNQMIGSTWTKIHGALTNNYGGSYDHPAIGEIYITAVDPDYAGSGLGRALTITALNYLKRLRLVNAMLYVDFENARALKLYRSIGFTVRNKDNVYILRNMFKIN
jgi:mycothiol synthase